jgi:hypothetical protein
MKIFQIILLILIALMSITAGAAKALLVPEELAFLEGVGIPQTMIVIYGVLQILGGVVMLVPRTKQVGLIIAIIAFAISTVLIFISGRWSFGLVSLLPILISSWLLFSARQQSQTRVPE